MKATKIVFVLLLIGIVFRLNAQQFKAFTHEPEAYLEEMQQLFARSESNYKTGKELLDKFEVKWLSGEITESQKQNIYRISDLMLQKNARNFPHFYEYIATIYTFTETSIDTSNYNAWEKGLEFLLNNPKMKQADLQNYLADVQYLLTKNAVYYSSTVKWIASNNHFNITFVNDTLRYVFETIDLAGYLRNDSIIIYNTKGEYIPQTNTWNGQEATVYWEKAGLDRQTTWAESGPFRIQLNSPYYTIPGVKFYHKTYFEHPIIGTLTDKVVEAKEPTGMTYPKFESDEKQFEINGLFTDIDYKGGFAMSGGKFLGSGTTENFATLSLWRDTEVVKNGDTIIEKRLFMKTQSLFYAFRKTEIASNNAKITMYLDTDSIYHPGLLFKYYDKNREINLIRDKDPENMSRSPYYNTYHMIEMDFELLVWRMNEPQISISMLQGSTINIANFESANFFNAQRYYQAQGLEDIHPYSQLRSFSRKIGSESFYAEDFSRYLRLDITPTRRLLIELTYKGIVDYDFETEFCTIKPKLYNYLEAIVGKRDYDLINFESRTESKGFNAILNLTNMDLAIQGVPMVNVSDSQNVIFYPLNEEILLKRNRDFDFGGRIEAGFFTFYGDNFEFKYNDFKIVLNKIDSLSIKVKSGVNNWGQRVLTNVESVIEDITGDLVIDDPGNKSGIKKFPQYPIFESKKESFVFYDGNHIQNGKYTRDKFYFVVDPYKIDSLNNFSTEGMGYKGRLISSDIFPVIKETIVLQPDNSLGFTHATPQAGLPAFKGKGQYTSKINLSNRGLRGDGSLKYLTSKTTSNDFIFYPDSVNVYTTAFTIGKQTTMVQYPEVTASKVYVHWMPYMDKLMAKTVEKPFSMYKELAEHSGKLTYTPLSLTGSGTTSYFGASLNAKLFNYSADRFKTDSTGFKLTAINADKLAMETHDVSAKVDFITMKSEFRSNAGSTWVNLDVNKYMAFIEQFTWLMKEKKINLSTPNTTQVIEQGKTKIVEREDAGLPPRGSKFISTHFEQDSLTWESSDTDFDLMTNTLFAHKVKFITVADATVFPDQFEIVVEPNAKMRTLQKARVRANNTNKYHNFHTAIINISSRKKYHGEAIYDYTDENGRFFPIQFSLLAVDSLGNSFARGKIKGIDDFSLSPNFKYQGNVFLYAPDKLLSFKGSTRIVHDCNSIGQNWVDFESSIDPLEVEIPISSQPRDINGAFLVAGVMMATDSVHVFPSFLTPRKTYSNLPVITTEGFLRFNKKSKEYEIAQQHKLDNPDTTGNYLSLHKNACALKGEGKIDLTAKLGQVKLESVGNTLYDLPNDKLTLDVLMTINFFFPEKAIKFIADTLKTMTGLKPINLMNQNYIGNIKEFLPYAEADQMLKEQRIFGSVKSLPSKLTTTFALTELALRWDKSERSYISMGEFGVISALGTQINRRVKGFVEVQRRRSGDSFTFYIEIASDHWYFFNYKGGLMQAYSSEAAFNNIIADIKGNDRKQKIGMGEDSFVFFLSNDKKRNDFLKRMKGEKVEETEDVLPELDEPGTETEPTEEALPEFE